MKAAMIAFVLEMMKVWLEQWGFVMQKLAHRNAEKDQ